MKSNLPFKNYFTYILFLCNFITIYPMAQGVKNTQNKVAQNTSKEKNKNDSEKIPEGAVNVKDSLFLISFYKKMGGKNWNYKWILNQKISKWKGVTVESGFITGIELSKNNLVGEIPSDINELRFLKILDLSKNTLGGTIPESLFLLKDLRSLNLSKEITKSSSGKIIRPKIEIKSNKKEEEIMLENISAEPTEILAETVNDDLKTNASSKKKNDKLSIEILKNGLSGTISAQIGNLNKLEYLDLSGNMLNGILPNIQNLKKLKHCNLSVNQFEGNIPNEIKNLTSIQHLDLSHNKLNGIVPKEITQLKKIKYLSLAYNELSGEIPGLKDIDIEYIFMEGNRFDNDLPAAKKINQKQADIEKAREENEAKQKKKKEEKISSKKEEIDKPTETIENEIITEELLEIEEDPQVIEEKPENKTENISSDSTIEQENTNIQTK